MKVIKVENQVERWKSEHEIWRKNYCGAQTGLARQEAALEFYKSVESDLDFSNLTSVNLDEYVGAWWGQSAILEYFMQENLFNQKPFKRKFLASWVKDNAEESWTLKNQILADHPVDLQILGVVAMDISALTGLVLHWAVKVPHLVEPGSLLSANARFFDWVKMFQLKYYLSTMGIKNILMPSQLLSCLRWVESGNCWDDPRFSNWKFTSK